MIHYLKKKISGLKTKIKQKGIILMYHRVIDAKLDIWDLAVSQENFEQHLKILKKRNLGIPLAQFHDRLIHHKIGYNSLAVTFDDGYNDNFCFAAPLLSKYNIPATFFITTSPIGTRREFWWDELERLILTPLNGPSKISLNIENKIYEWHIDNETFGGEEYKTLNCRWKASDPIASQRHYIFLDLWKILKLSHHETQRNVLDQLQEIMGLADSERSENFPLTKDELISLSTIENYEIGAHTQHHPSLPSYQKAEQFKEIKNSKEYLQETVQKRVNGFAYPYGDYEQIALQAVKNVGFHYACTTEEKAVFNSQPSFNLPRFQVKNWNGKVFESFLKKWFNNLKM